VGDFSYVENPVSLSAICGHQYEIVLRGVTVEQSQINTACKALGQSGFINYFGLQRFGHASLKSHDIGKALIKSDWQACIDMLFANRVGGSHEFKEAAKTLYQNNQYKKALRVLPVSMHSEKMVLKKLISNPENLLDACNAFPKDTRMQCLHAYQSFIWNMAVTQRLILYGSHCVVGDLVSTNAAVLQDNDETSNSVENTNDHVEKTSEAVEAAATDRGVLGNDIQFSKSKDAVHIITTEDINSNTYSIGDVILPLIGYDSTLPGNELGQYIIKMLADDGLVLDSYKNCNIIYRMSGTYRRIIQQPKDFQWSVLSYDDPEAELVTTELTWFKTNTLKPASSPVASIVAATSNNVVNSTDSSASSSSSFSSIPSSDQGMKGRCRALKCKFQLTPGSYVTMLLRELTKQA
jgi:tRNA pseudouridine13 synthase